MHLQALGHLGHNQRVYFLACKSLKIKVGARGFEREWLRNKQIMDDWFEILTNPHVIIDNSAQRDSPSSPTVSLADQMLCASARRRSFVDSVFLPGPLDSFDNGDEMLLGDLPPTYANCGYGGVASADDSFAAIGQRFLADFNRGNRSDRGRAGSRLAPCTSRGMVFGPWYRFSAESREKGGSD
jgi:hypothetical protein